MLFRSGTGVAIEAELEALPLGKGIIRRQGKKVALLAFGAPLAEALIAAETLDASVADMRFVKPIDAELIIELARTHDLLVTLEDGAIQGGAGSAVLEVLAQAGVHSNVLILGIPDRYIDHASPSEQYADCGLDVAGILAAVEQKLTRI